MSIWTWMGINKTGDQSPETLFPTDASNDTYQWGDKGQDAVYPDGQAAPNYVPGTSGAEKDIARFRQGAADARLRAAPTADYTAGNSAAGQGLAARGGQAGALSMIGARAQGQGPSAAMLGMNRGNDQVAQSQLAAMAGAGYGIRGSASNGALALQSSVNSGAGGYDANVANAGQQRSAELANAQNAMFNGYSDMRGADINGMHMQDARTQQQANAEMQQRGLNQNTALGYEGLGWGTEAAQLGANQYRHNAAQQHRLQQAKLDQESTENGENVFDSILGSAAKAAGAAYTGGATSDYRAKNNVQSVGIHSFRRGQ